MQDYEYYCPSCGRRTVHELKTNPELMSCECGMTWRTVSSDIHIAVSQDVRMDIMSVLQNTLKVYKVKDEEVNKSREYTKQKAIDYLMRELMKGPIKGGTMSEPSSVCSLFGSDLWTALQRAVLIRDEYCMICHHRPSKEVHHIRPRHLKGKDHPRNLIGLCLECHDEVHRRIDSGIQRELESSLEIDISMKQTKLDLGAEF